MIKSATVVRERGVNLDGEHHPKGAVLRLSSNQFDDLAGVGIVREATNAEVSSASEKRAVEKLPRNRAAKTESAATAEATPPVAG